MNEALNDPSARVLITTYTRENLAEIGSRLWSGSASAPHQVVAMTWFEFLLREGIKPYQAYKTDILSIRSVNFDSQPPRYAREANFDQYFVDSAGNVYRDRVSNLACKLDDLSGGRVVARLARCFSLILLDEIQDFAGYDLELVRRLLDCGARVIGVGDPRQSVYVTNYSPKNKGLRRAQIVEWIEQQEAAGLVAVSNLTDSYRCNQPICDYADALYPDLPETVGKNTEVVDHMGVHLVHVDDLERYREELGPQELRWDRRNSLALPSARNFGEVKGKSFNRVLIFPTNPMSSYIESGTELAQGARSKFYVAVTRARHSVGLVTRTRASSSGLPYWA
ncbi:MAG: AAA family ATPase [Demequina sp.]